jgi:GMP synthase-like glutamine amidotransferase
LPAEFLSGIDAAINGYGPFADKAYFFKGDEYVRYDWARERIDLKLPLSAWQPPSPCSWRIDAALEGQGQYVGKSYFFRQGVYVRYDWKTQSCDLGPAPIGLWNLPEPLLYPSGKIRDHIWYVTIDEIDYFQRGLMGHSPNLSRLQDTAKRVGVQVDPIWMANLNDEFLADDTLLALFAAGSFPEWFLAASDDNWSRYLDRYCEQIRNTDVPILAICGSHQLVGRAFASWDAVGHMVRADQLIPTIADEFEQNTSLSPQPRLGEVGVYPFRICAGQEMDPLLAGLPDQLWFVESHHDQVISGRRHPDFEAVLESDPDIAPTHWRADDPPAHVNPPSFNDRCRVQALRLSGSDRVLYTVEFHPDASARDSRIDWQSEQLVRNLFQIARRSWENR